MKRKNFNIFNEILINLPESKIEVIPNDQKDKKVALQMTKMLNFRNKYGMDL